MKPETLELLSTISYVLAGVFLLLTIFFTFKFRIWAVMGDLSGRTARKSIERMRKANELERTRNSHANAMPEPSVALMPEMQDRRLVGENREANIARRNELMPETGLLTDNRAISDTGHLQNGATLEEDTGLLLTQDEVHPVMADRVQNRPRTELTMLKEIILIHTDEVIS